MHRLIALLGILVVMMVVGPADARTQDDVNANG